MIAALVLALATGGCDAPMTDIPREVAAASYVVIGEVHGTTEAPAFTGRLACALASRGESVTVALELTSSLQDAIDAYMVSDGTGPARADLVKLGFTPPRQGQWDGRSSAAMLALIESARQQARAGRKVRVVAIDVPTIGIKSDEVAKAWRERDIVMARNAIAALPQGGKVVVHVGGLHAVRHLSETPRPPPYSPLAWLLPTKETIALHADPRGGNFWGCIPECGVNPLRAYYDDATLDGRIVMRRGRGYDGIAHLGPVTVSSLPDP